MESFLPSPLAASESQSSVGTDATLVGFSPFPDLSASFFSPFSSTPFPSQSSCGGEVLDFQNNLETVSLESPEPPIPHVSSGAEPVDWDALLITEVTLELDVGKQPCLPLDLAGPNPESTPLPTITSPFLASASVSPQLPLSSPRRIETTMTPFPSSPEQRHSLDHHRPYTRGASPSEQEDDPQSPPNRKTCPHCGVQTLKLPRHLRTSCTKNPDKILRPVVCDRCGRSFTRVDNMERHKSSGRCRMIFLGKSGLKANSR